MSRSTCPRVHLVEARRDGRLAASDVASVERHLETCSTCARHAADLARIRDALRGEDPTITPLEHRRARASLLRAAAAPVAPRAAPRRATTMLAAAAILIAGTAVAAIGLPDLWRGAPGPAPSAGVPEPAPSADEPGPAPPAVVSAAPSAVIAPMPPESPTAPSTPASARATSSPSPRSAPQSPAPRASAAPPTASTPEPATSVAARSRALHDAVEAIERGDYGQASRHLDDARSAETDPERAELATYLQAVSLQRAGRVDEARAVAREYLARHPGGRFVGEARRIADGG